MKAKTEGADASIFAAALPQAELSPGSSFWKYETDWRTVPGIRCQPLVEARRRLEKEMERRLASAAVGERGAKTELVRKRSWAAASTSEYLRRE